MTNGDSHKKHRGAGPKLRAALVHSAKHSQTAAPSQPIKLKLAAPPGQAAADSADKE